MEIKIISDGSIEGTKVVDKDSGEELDWVDEIQIIASMKNPNKGVRALLSFINVEIDIETDVQLDEEE